MTNDHDISYTQQESVMIAPRLRQSRIFRLRARRRSLFARWNARLISGRPAIGTTLPVWFADNAMLTYVLALLITNALFFSRSTEGYFIAFGFMWVAGFFYLARHFARLWSPATMHRTKAFEYQLFWSAFAIRAVYVIFIYFFYAVMTGRPFEYSAADSFGYTELAQEWTWALENDMFQKELQSFIQYGVSDVGYPLFLFVSAALFREGAIIASRLLQSLIGAYTAVLVYRLAHRSMDETTARMAAIFCVLHPVLICYVGLSLKEVLMTFLVVLFIEQADKLLRGRNYTFGSIFPVVLIGLSLFLFRTVLGMIAFMAVLFALLMVDDKVVTKGRKIAIGGAMAIMLIFTASDRIIREIQVVSNTDIAEQQRLSMSQRYGTNDGKRKVGGNSFAQYAGAAVFAPMIFTIPFPTMVATEGQEDMRLIHGGNWVRNIMSGLVILAMVMLLLSGDWRQYTLPLAMMLGYLVMLVFTQFAHSLRFHIPVMPFEMLFAAYALTHMRRRHIQWYKYWCYFMVLTCVAWNWFKLAGRGLV